MTYYRNESQNMTKFFLKICLLTILTWSFTAKLYAAKTDEPVKNTHWRFSGIPAFGFGADTGIGGGIIVNMYEEEEGFEPYKSSLGLKFYLTSKLVNSHALKYDRVNAFGLPWRITSRIGFYSTPSQNYCGMGSDGVNCSETNARAAAPADLAGDKLEEFTRHYYLNRYMSLYGEVFSSWLLYKSPDNLKLNLINSYRGNYYWHRYFSQRGSYPNSLYARDFSQTKQEGYLSTLEIGLMLDSRDNESVPTSGYWLESSIRGAAKFMGSAWNYFGANLAARFYWSLDDAHHLVVASQTVVDSIVGDLPYDAMSRLGGSQALSDHNAFGGQFMGRGIREQLYVGRFKAITQLELRYNFWSFMLWKQNFDLVGAAFADVGVAAWDYSRFARDLKHVHVGFGPGLRIYWDKTFVIRADLGISPDEKFTPRFYLVVGNVF
jgi:hypothetical protein